MEISVQKRMITTEAAFMAARAAIKKAEEFGVAINVSVVDSASVEIAFLRMNHAFLPSRDIARDKAFTSSGFGFATSEWKEILNGNQQLQAGIIARPKIVTFAGGLPIFEGGELIGAIGVSGGSEEQDVECAQAGINALELDND